MQGAGFGFLLGEDRMSKDFSCGMDCVRCLSCQVRPGSHPANERPAPFGPGPEETGTGAFEVGPIDNQPLDIWRFDRNQALRQAGEHSSVLQDGTEEEHVIGNRNPGIELLLVLGLWIPGQFAASRPYSWVRDIRLPEQVQCLPELLLGRFGRHGTEPEFSGHECGGGVGEADRGSGVVLEGEPYGLDGAVEGMTGDRRTREGLELEAVGSWP